MSTKPALDRGLHEKAEDITYGPAGASAGGLDEERKPMSKPLPPSPSRAERRGPAPKHASGGTAGRFLALAMVAGLALPLLGACGSATGAIGNVADGNTSIDPCRAYNGLYWADENILAYTLFKQSVEPTDDRALRIFGLQRGLAGLRLGAASRGCAITIATLALPETAFEAAQIAGPETWKKPGDEPEVNPDTGLPAAPSGNLTK